MNVLPRTARSDEKSKAKGNESDREKVMASSDRLDARVNSICSCTLAGFEHGSWRLADCALIFALFCFSFLSPGAKADVFASEHRADIKEMTVAGIRLQEEWRRYTWSQVPDDDRSPAAYNEVAGMNSDCYWLVYARFYLKFRALIDGLDTSPLADTREFEEMMKKKSVLRNPKQIVVLARMRISALHDVRGGEAASAGDFAIDYARRPDLESKCHGYLDATGLR
jgi:hypothetical protein